MSQMSSQLTAESKQYANRARDLARQVGVVSGPVRLFCGLRWWTRVGLVGLMFHSEKPGLALLLWLHHQGVQPSTSRLRGH